MIKVIAFDLIGVLSYEKDIELSIEEQKLERLFGPNISDEEYLKQANNIVKEKSTTMLITKNIINKLYYTKDKYIFTKLNKDYPNIKLIIATNHISYIKEYINKSFDTTYLDDIIISADINKIKPNKDFYKYILTKYKIKPEDLLFLDDNIKNIESANSLGINTIKVDKNTNIYKAIKEVITWENYT